MSLFFSKIEKIVNRISPLSRLVAFVTTKIVPIESVAAAACTIAACSCTYNPGNNTTSGRYYFRTDAGQLLCNGNCPFGPFPGNQC